MPQIITAAATLGGALAGALLTLRHARRIRDDDRAEQHRSLQSASVVDVIDLGHKWASSAEGMIMMFATVTDMVAVAKTEAVDRAVEVGAKYDRALVAARLTVTKPVVAQHIRTLSKVKENWSDVNGPVLKSAKELGRADTEVIGKALAYVRGYEREIENLERAALDELAPNIGPRRISRWKLRGLILRAARMRDRQIVRAKN